MVDYCNLINRCKNENIINPWAYGMGYIENKTVVKKEFFKLVM